MAELKNAKHEAVLAAYIADPKRIGWKAYKAVYAKCSQHTAESAFSALMKKPEFSARLRELLAATAERASVTAADVIEELRKLGFSNFLNYVDVLRSGDVSGLRADDAAAIQELTVDTYLEGQREVKRVRVKLHDKRAALVDIGRQLGMFKNVHEHMGKNGGPIELKDVSEFTDLEVARRIAFVLERSARARVVASGRARPVDPSRRSPAPRRQAAH